MERLAPAAALVIRQKREMGEILSGFEMKNRYEVLDLSGTSLYQAREEGGSWLLRIFLQSARPFEIVVRDAQQQLVVGVQRPFRFYFHEAEISDGRGNILGKIEKRFSLLNREYAVLDETGNEIFKLYGPLLHPWTFLIKKGNLEVGKISKKWSGLATEAFTDADHFGVTFPQDLSTRQKALMLGAVFLVDFVHFERNR